MVWPGLNAPVVRGKEVVERVQLPPDKQREEKLLQLRNEMHGFRPLKLTPLERGWCGTRAPGRSIGPPDPVGDETFEKFDTIVVESRMVSRMTGNLGRTRRHKAVVVVGNKNGLIGFASGKAPEAKAALRMAKNRAIQRLRYIDRFEDHTVYHNFFTQYGPMKMMVRKKPRGYGLVCHRIFKEVCKLAGITDIHVKLMDCRAGSATVLLRAFILGLHNQVRHFAQRKAPWLVLFQAGPFIFTIRALARQPGKMECSYGERLGILSSCCIQCGGRLVKPPPKYVPWYIRHNTKGWQVHLRKVDPYRNAYNTRLQLTARYGKLCSFVNPDGVSLYNKPPKDKDAS
ncbi:ribosomal protein S5, putative [Ixodes scapularis]|uniref:Small ribosomal subunit protein uS5m n=2 Tax=Ixodes scapularis TaxID=6945 RepID=B7P5Y2_IXOSC|nr:ribosomal protein S5, putative [Ixodes scapularis]|eukprot:XP_002408094.1 ribosomal protein S5, putative [Ixodes scapularis]